MAPSVFRLGNINCHTHSIPQLLEEVRALLNDKSLRPRTILCVNAHILNLAWSDPVLRQILNNARFVVADGMSIVGAARVFGARIPERCNMTEAFRAFLQTDNMPHSKGALVGLTPDEASPVASAIKQMSSHCHIVRIISGYLNEADYEQAFASLGEIDFVFIGMGTPRTERISRVASTVCPNAIVWGVGGGTMTIFAGTMKEAPVFWRRSGLQWLYRLFQDPATLWRRYLIGNPLFMYRIIKSALCAKLGRTRSTE